ncbi:MAG: DUF6883 domain-containing protein, partial [Cyanobacteria bacterium J06635_13]
MRLPNGDRAEISRQKLLGYCLNPNHASGKHKAKVFASALGITADNVGILNELIQKVAIEGEVIQQSTTEFGQQFKVDWTVPQTQNIELRTIWEISHI